jgi:hypothetical protein
MGATGAFAGAAELDLGRRRPEGSYDESGEAPRFRIRDYDSMPPFLMSLVSEGDHWLFVSSSGALTAGRRDPDHALFPYSTDDRIHASAGATGSRTIVRASLGGGPTLIWEPFSPRYEGIYRITRTVSKSAYGNEVEFEERNESLGLAFSYSWTTSWKYGFVRRARLANAGKTEASIEILDGLLDIMPAELSRRFQADFSTLADGYRDCELIGAGGGLVALYRLSSIPVDRAEPSEALRANTVWSAGLPAPRGRNVYLSADCIDAFRAGLAPEGERRLRGRRGAYLERSAFVLGPGAEQRWNTVGDVAADAAAVSALAEELSAGGMEESVERDVAEGTESLRRIVAAVDGLQLTGDSLPSWRHYSNAIFNAMRGGFPPGGYGIDARDFAERLRHASAATFSRNDGWLAGLGERIDRDGLVRSARATGDADLERVAREYLPLAFSRRHGDPSRPWNSFSIPSKGPEGERLLGYEGNWRDIFQNWEALSLSYPGFLDSMIFKFLDSSTADGYNPYRITRDGFEWETIEPADAWSFIGYWGDHQAAYLLRLLDAAERYRPGELSELLGRRIFAYAQVPYRIRDYDSILADPKATVEFDSELHGWILERARAAGADGKLLRDAKGSPVRASLAEKLLVPMLAKLSNFVDEGGIWMNTQRPEWNDANNALVGFGVSVVTACYLRALASFCLRLFEETDERLQIAAEVARLVRSIAAALGSTPARAGGRGSPLERRSLMDALGYAGSEYRIALYSGGLSGVTETVAARELAGFFALVRDRLDRCIRANRRPDGLYHAYNLLELGHGTADLRRLPVMLEGQVAVLASGILSPEETADLLEALRASELYRADQSSYLLYPDRDLPGFLEKNRIGPGRAASSRLLAELERSGDFSIVRRDLDGCLRFNADLHNARDLGRALDALADRGDEAARLAEEERSLVLELYEDTFDHHSFTGRSGTFYKYEGLGCIYWHMVSKLLLAVGESLARARDGGAGPAVLGRIESAYREIRSGLGTWKSPADYGAFTVDPYSHTPSFAGAQQPGMTGQVKEDLISRFAELGASVAGGRLRFAPSLAIEREALGEPREFRYVDASGEPRSVRVDQGCIAFTICQVLVVVHRGDPDEEPRLIVTKADGCVETAGGLELGERESRSVFGRDLSIARLDVCLGAAYHGRRGTGNGQ